MSYVPSEARGQIPTPNQSKTTHRGLPPLSAFREKLQVRFRRIAGLTIHVLGDEQQGLAGLGHLRSGAVGGARMLAPRPSQPKSSVLSGPAFPSSPPPQKNKKSAAPSVHLASRKDEKAPRCDLENPACLLQHRKNGLALASRRRVRIMPRRKPQNKSNEGKKNN